MSTFPVTESNVMTTKSLLSLITNQNNGQPGFSKLIPQLFKSFQFNKPGYEIVTTDEGPRVEKPLSLIERVFLFTMKWWNKAIHHVRSAADVIDVEVGDTRKAFISTPAEVEYNLRVRNIMRLAEWYRKRADMREEEELAAVRSVFTSTEDDAMRLSSSTPRSLEYDLFQAEVKDVRMCARRMSSVPECKKGVGVLTCSVPFLNPTGLTYRRSYTARLRVVQESDHG